MTDIEKVIKAWEIFRDSNPYEICDGREFRAIAEPEYCMGHMIADTIDLLKEQKTVLQKMWNALFAEEDKLEKQFAGTDKNDIWFMVYRPWLQRGFEIAIEVIAKQEGGEVE